MSDEFIKIEDTNQDIKTINIQEINIPLSLYESLITYKEKYHLFMKYLINHFIYHKYDKKIGLDINSIELVSFIRALDKSFDFKVHMLEVKNGDSDE